MALYQFGGSVIADTGTKAGQPLGRALPDGAEISWNGGVTVMGLARHITLPAGLTLDVAADKAAKILAAVGPYTGSTAKKAVADWVVT